MNILCKDNSDDIIHDSDSVYDSEKYPQRLKRQINESNQSFESLDLNVTKNQSSFKSAKDTKDEMLQKFEKLWPVTKWREMGYFTDDYLNLINEHWLSFPPPNATMQKVLATIYIFFSTAGCWGNMIVLFMYLRSVK